MDPSRYVKKRDLGIQIFGERELARRLAEGGEVYSHCISIRSPHENMPMLPTVIVAGFKGIHNLEFHDVESRDLLPEEFRNLRVPELRDVISVLQFSSHAVLDPECTGFTVHCRRGVSRSSAVALGLLFLLVKDETRAVEQLRRIRPEALPLLRIVRFWDQLLGTCLILPEEQLRAQRIKEMNCQFFASDHNTETSYSRRAI